MIEFNNRSGLFFPLLLITFGLSFLLFSLDAISGSMTVFLDFVFLALLDLFINDINKRTVVYTPMMIYFGFSIFLLSNDWMPYGKRSVLIAFGMIVLGILLIFSRHGNIPEADDAVTHFFQSRADQQHGETLCGSKNRYLIVDKDVLKEQKNQQGENL